MVLTTSKYNRASAPVLPIAFMFSMPAMPVTTVQKMIGAIIILMSLMKPSPSGLNCVAVSGKKCPSSTPIAMAIRTWTYRDLYQRCGSAGESRASVDIPKA
jgi:hypothetical protein